MIWLCSKYFLWLLKIFIADEDIDNQLWSTEIFNPSANNKIVALKEIRLQEEEGAPFTAIREGNSFIMYSF